METSRPLALTPAAGTRTVTRPGISDTADATWSEADWRCVVFLRRGGVSDPGLRRLLRLRRTYHGVVDPATDGLERDARALFARWLVAQGRLHEGI